MGQLTPRGEHGAATKAFEEPRMSDIFGHGLVIAAVVGSVLNGINQWEALLRQAQPDMIKLALTYLVPFCVSCYASFTTRRRFLAEMARCGMR